MKGWEGVSRTATFNFSFEKKFYRGGILPRGDFSREIVGTLPKHSCKPSLDLKEPVISVQRLAQSIIKCTHRHRLTSCYFYIRINPTNLITPFRVIIKHFFFSVFNNLETQLPLTLTVEGDNIEASENNKQLCLDGQKSQLVSIPTK